MGYRIDEINYLATEIEKKLQRIYDSFPDVWTRNKHERIKSDSSSFKGKIYWALSDLKSIKRETEKIMNESQKKI